MSDHENVASGSPALIYVAAQSAATPTFANLPEAPTEMDGWETSSLGMTGGPATWRDAQTHQPVRAEQFALPIDYRAGEATYTIEVPILETHRVETMRKIWGLSSSAVTSAEAQAGVPGYVQLNRLYGNQDPVQVILAYLGVDGFPVWTYLPMAKFIQETTEGQIGRSVTSMPTVTIAAIQPTDGTAAVQFIRQTEAALDGGSS